MENYLDTIGKNQEPVLDMKKFRKDKLRETNEMKRVLKEYYQL